MSPSVAPKYESTHSAFWISVPSFGRSDVYHYCLSLGWSPTAYEARATSADANERSWLLSLATDSSFAVAPPWSTYNKGKNIYAANLFKRSGEEATPTAVPIFPPPLDSFRVAQNRTVWNDLLVPAAQVVDPFMLRPLAEFTADGDLIPPPSLQGLPLSPLAIGHRDSSRSVRPFWKPSHRSLNWSRKHTWKYEHLELGVLKAVKAIHDATGTKEGGTLKWNECGSSGRVSKETDFKITHTSQDRSSIVMTMEVEPFLTLADAANMIAKAREGSTQFATNSASWLLDADAKLGRAIRHAEHEGAPIACIHGGAGVLIILERVHITDMQYDWIIWPEIIAHMALADAAVGEAGPDATACSSPGERTLPVDNENVTVLTRYGIVPILVALAEYAKRAHLQHAFAPLKVQTKGNVVINGGAKAVISAFRGAHNHQKTGKGAASPSLDGHTMCIDKASQDASSTSVSTLSSQQTFVLGETAFAQGKRADIWVAYRSQESLKLNDDESLFYKNALPCGFARLGDAMTAPLDVEVSIYERAKELQGRYIPKLVAVFREREALAHSAELGFIDGLAIRPEYDQVTAMVISSTGVSLQILAWLGFRNQVAVDWAYQRLPAGYLGNLARGFIKRNITSVDAAAICIALLIDDAFEAFHKCNVSHNSVFIRNMCLRVNEASELRVSLIDFERSELLTQHDWTSRDIKAHLWSAQEEKFAREKSEARTEALQAVSSFWRILKLLMARLKGEQSTTRSKLPFAKLIEAGALD